jgi:quinol monooxygenase YgiN
VPVENRGFQHAMTALRPTPLTCSLSILLSLSEPGFSLAHPSKSGFTEKERLLWSPRRQTMVKFALYGSLKAKPGKEAEVEAFLKQGAELAKKEPGTVTWYAIKEAPGQYGIFDTFQDEAARDAHLNGEIARQLMAKADELLAAPPQIHKIDLLAVK